MSSGPEEQLHARICFFLKSQVGGFYPSELTGRLKNAGFHEITEKEVEHFLNMMLNEHRVSILSFGLLCEGKIEPHLEIEDFQKR